MKKNTRNKNLTSEHVVHQKNLSSSYFYMISFLEGAAVMAVELLSAKMVAPFYGNSIYVWASVLGVTLGGLAGGYFLGGLISKKFPETKALFYIIFAASLVVFIMPSWGNIILKMTLTLELITATLVSCILFLLPPLLLFGMTSPVIINLLTKKHEDAGKISGTVYAVSTIGGIFMTFLTGFYLIPELGIKISLYITAFVLFMIPFVYFVSKKKLLIPGIILGFFLLFVVQASSSGTKERTSHVKVLHKSDGLAGQLLVVDDIKTQKRSLLVNNISQTFMHIPTGKSQWLYVHRIALYSSFKPAGNKALVCGLGGGNLINELYGLGFEVDAVDLDPRMKMLATKYFYMPDEVPVYTDDASHYIRTTRKKYDIIVLDLSAGENQPSNVYTLECFTEIKKILKNNGILFLHYQNVLEGKHALAVKSLGKTLQKAGFYCHLIDTKISGNEIGEVMFFASKDELDLEKQSFARRDPFVDPFNFPMGKGIYIENYSFSDGLVLTDDKQPMDFLHVNTLDQTRGTSTKFLIPVLFQEDIELIE